MRIAHPAGHRQIEPALQQHRDRTVELLAAGGRDIGTRRRPRRAVAAAEADAGGAGRHAGIAVRAWLAVAAAVREGEPDCSGEAEILILPGDAPAKVERAAIDQRGGELEPVPDRGVVADAIVALEPIEIVKEAAHRGPV